MTTPQPPTEHRWPNTALGDPPDYLRPDADPLHRQAAWVHTLWRDWPQSRREAVAALSAHLAAAVEALGPVLDTDRQRQDGACEEVATGLHGAPLGPCWRRGSHRIHEDDRGQTWWRMAGRTVRSRMADASAAPADRVETAARLLHSRRHPLGYGHTCDRCRADAEAVAAVLTGETP